MNEQDTVKPKHRKLNRGGWNLLVLGAISVVIAVATTSVSLAIYHNSGDIYLDRSRPGYLPDESEALNEDDDELEYKMSKTGEMNMTVLEEYLNNLEAEVKVIDAYDKPFGQEALSDGKLGIPVE